MLVLFLLPLAEEEGEEAIEEEEAGLGISE